MFIMPTFELILLGGSALLVLSVIASKASGKLGVPALLLFLIIGMLVGSDGPGGVYFDDARLTQSLGIVALALILFSGGLDTDWQQIRPVLPSGLALATIGGPITALLVGLFAAALLGFPLLEGLLLGAIVCSTDAAAVFAVMRARGARLKGRLGALIELESGSNDPMAVFLTITFTGLLLNPATSLGTLLWQLCLQMTLGALAGYVLGRTMTLLVNRLRLEYEGLYPVLTLGMALFTYAVAAAIGGNGFLAVYLAGLTMGNRDFVHKRSLTRFHDGIAWLMQIVMFLTLGLLVFPSALPSVAGSGLLISSLLMFAARPISVFIILLPTRFNWREKLMISWVGLRGAVPIILATFPQLAGLPRSDMIFNLVFFIVLTSVMIQGTTIPMVARWLRLAAPPESAYHYPLEYVPAINTSNRLQAFRISEQSEAVGRSLMEIGLPASALVVLIQREGTDIVPNGGTVVRPSDNLLILADEKTLAQLQEIFG